MFREYRICTHPCSDIRKKWGQIKIFYTGGFSIRCIDAKEIFCLSMWKEIRLLSLISPLFFSSTVLYNMDRFIEKISFIVILLKTPHHQYIFTFVCLIEKPKSILYIVNSTPPGRYTNTHNICINNILVITDLIVSTIFAVWYMYNVSKQKLSLFLSVYRKSFLTSPPPPSPAQHR